MSISFFIISYINVVTTESGYQIKVGPLCTQQSKDILLSGLYASNYAEFSLSFICHFLVLG